MGLGCRDRMSTGEYYPLSISHSMPALSTLSELGRYEESELKPAPALVRTSSSIELSGGALCAILLTVVGGRIVYDGRGQ